MRNVGLAALQKKDYAGAASRLEEALPRVTDAGKRTVLFNLACAYALSGRTSEALDRLEKAVAEGFGPREAIEGDDDLASLRGEARYAEIVAKAKPRS